MTEWFLFTPLLPHLINYISENTIVTNFIKIQPQNFTPQKNLIFHLSPKIFQVVNVPSQPIQLCLMSSLMSSWQKLLTYQLLHFHSHKSNATTIKPDSSNNKVGESFQNFESFSSEFCIFADKCRLYPVQTNVIRKKLVPCNSCCRFAFSGQTSSRVAQVVVICFKILKFLVYYTHLDFYNFWKHWIFLLLK